MSVGINEDYISGFMTSAVLFISNHTAETKLTILAFLCCADFMKNSILFLPLAAQDPQPDSLVRTGFLCHK